MPSTRRARGGVYRRGQLRTGRRNLFLRVYEDWAEVTFGFDLALTEVLNAEQHYFVVEVGTLLGAELLQDVPHQPATAEARGRWSHCGTDRPALGRTLDTTDIKPLLYRNYEHPRWDEVAAPA